MTDSEEIIKDLSPDQTASLLDEVRRYLFVIYVKRSDITSSIDKPLDDVVQEGVIHAWDDIQAGIYTKRHILHRASIWSKSFFSTRRPPTGKPAMSRDFITTADGRARIEKVKNFRNEWFELHDAFPTAQQIADGVGVSVSWAAKVSRNIKNGDLQEHSDQFRDQFGDLDFSKAVAFSIEGAKCLTEEHHLDSGGEPKFLLQYAHGSAEEDWFSEQGGLDLLDLLKDDKQRTAVYLYFWQDWSQTEIGEYLGGYSNPQVAASRIIQTALVQLGNVQKPRSVRKHMSKGERTEALADAKKRYESGHSTGSISRETGWPQTTVRRLLREAGVVARPHGTNGHERISS